MHRWQLALFHRRSHSVVVDNLNVIRVTRFPSETDSPLHVDRNVPLPRSIALELLETVARRDEEIVYFDRRVEHLQLSQRGGLDVWRNVSRSFSGEQPLRFVIGPALH